MASLAAFRVNTARINDGKWVTVNPEDPFELKVRGFTAAYRDQLNALRRAAAQRLNRHLQPGQPPYAHDQLPPTADDQCQADAAAEYLFLDVRGLGGPDNAPVSADGYRAMLRSPAEYSALLLLTLGAAGRVHSDREDDVQAAVGNSPAASEPS